MVQHTPEIGLRVALGAKARDIVRFVAGRGLLLAGRRPASLTRVSA